MPEARPKMYEKTYGWIPPLEFVTTGPSRNFLFLRPVFGLGAVMRNHCFQFQCFGVCVSVPSCETTHVSCGCGEHRIRAASCACFVVCASNCSSRLRLRDLHPDLSWESYSYRIGTVHMCRDAAYADAGVLPGALHHSLLLTSLGLH